MKKTTLLSLFLLTVLTLFAQDEKKPAIEMPKRKLSLEATAGFLLIPYQATATLNYQVGLRNQLGIGYTSFGSSNYLTSHTFGAKGVGIYWSNRIAKRWKTELGFGYLLGACFRADVVDEIIRNRTQSTKGYTSISIRRYFLGDHLSLGLNANLTGEQVFDFFNQDKWNWVEKHSIKSFTLSLGVKL